MVFEPLVDWGTFDDPTIIHRFRAFLTGIGPITPLSLKQRAGLEMDP